MKEITGKVWYNEDQGDSSRNYMEVTSENGDTLGELLSLFDGKKVKITIEAVE